MGPLLLFMVDGGRPVPTTNVPIPEIPVVPDVPQPAPDMNVTPQRPESGQFSSGALDVPSTSSSQMSQRVEVRRIISSRRENVSERNKS